MIDSKIAVIGMSCKFNTADSVYEMHRTLMRGKVCKCGDNGERALLTGYSGTLGLDKRIAFIDDIEYFDNEFFGIGQEATKFSPELRKSLELAIMAVLDGGYMPDKLKGTACGVIASISGKGYKELCDGNDILSDYGSSPSMVAGYIGHYLGIEGPVMMTDSDACTSSVGIITASDLLHNGSADMMLVGGTELALFSDDSGADMYISSLSPDNQCIPYSRKAKGTVTGEGSGFILLKRLEDAVRDGDYIYGTIIGYSCGSSGQNSSSPYYPSSNVQFNVIKRAWQNTGGISPTEFEGGAIGIADSDRAEADAFSSFAENKVICGSVRHATGHTGHLCGLASIIKTMLSYKNSVVYPLGSYATKGMIKAENLEFPSVPIFLDRNKNRYTGINSFGVNGACVHIAVCNYTENHGCSDCVDNDNRLVVLSATSVDSLTALMEQIEEYLVRNDADINDVIYTINSRRKLYPVRCATFCNNRRELLDMLSSCCTASDADMNEIILLVEDRKNISSTSVTGRFLQSGLFVCYIAEYNNNELTVYRYEKPEVRVEYSDIASPLIISEYDNILADLVITDENYEETIKYCALHSAKIDWEKHYSGKLYRNYPMPSYVFRKNRFWNRTERKTIIIETVSDDNTAENNIIAEPSSEKEQKLMDIICKLWKKHLEIPYEIGYDDNFFEIGGNSLTGGMSLAELKETTGVDISFTDVYENPTARSITQFYLKRRYR